jgi:hypothetical protein
MRDLRAYEGIARLAASPSSVSTSMSASPGLKTLARNSTNSWPRPVNGSSTQSWFGALTVSLGPRHESFEDSVKAPHYCYDLLLVRVERIRTIVDNAQKWQEAN